MKTYLMILALGMFFNQASFADFASKSNCEDKVNAAAVKFAAPNANKRDRQGVLNESAGVSSSSVTVKGNTRTYKVTVQITDFIGDSGSMDEFEDLIVVAQGTADACKVTGIKIAPNKK